MPPKRGKSGDRNAPKSEGAPKWEAGLLAAELIEETWKASVNFIVPNKLDDNQNLDTLIESVGHGKRRLFSVISKDTLFKEVNELGNPKLKKGKDVPAHYEVCATVKLILDNQMEVPPQLMARLLKFKLLSVKQADLKRREDEKKQAFAKAKPGGAPLKEAKGAKSAIKGGAKGKKTPDNLPAAPRKDSKLKKRGEEDDEGRYIDDEPDDGPQHYVIIHGFMNPAYIYALNEIGISVDSVIRFSSETYTRFEVIDQLPVVEEEPGKKPKAEAAPMGEEGLQLQKEKRKSVDTFWSDLELFLGALKPGSRMFDLARLCYVVNDNILPKAFDDVELRNEFGSAIFEEVACLLYDMLDWRRQYRNYSANVRIIKIPEVTDIKRAEELQEAAEPPAASKSPRDKSPAVKKGAHHPPRDVEEPVDTQMQLTNDIDMRYYSNLITSVPNESFSVSLLMHCMLEQITAYNEDCGLSSEDAVAASDGEMNAELAKYFADALCNVTGGSYSDVQTTKLSDSNQPIILHCRDNIALRTQHLVDFDQFNIQQAERDMLQLFPSSLLCDFPVPPEDVRQLRSSRLQELILHCTAGILTKPEVDRAFKQFVFECLKLRKVDDETELIMSDGDETFVGDGLMPWDDPFPYLKHLQKSLERHTKRFGEIRIGSAQSVKQEDEPLLLRESDAGLSSKGKRTKSPKSPRDEKRSSSIIRPRSKERSPSGRRNSTVRFKGSKESIPSIKDEVTLSREISNVSLQMSESLGSIIDSKLEAKRNKKTSKRIGINDIEDCQQRSLDDWIYAEHFKPDILIQVLEDARFELPFMDTYYHKADNSLLVVMHNPVGKNLISRQPWDTYLHANVGFRSIGIGTIQSF